MYELLSIQPSAISAIAIVNHDTPLMVITAVDCGRFPGITFAVINNVFTEFLLTWYSNRCNTYEVSDDVMRMQCVTPREIPCYYRLV